MCIRDRDQVGDKHQLLHQLAVELAAALGADVTEHLTEDGAEHAVDKGQLQGCLLYTSSAKLLARLPSLFWKGLWLNVSRRSQIALFSSNRDKNWRFRRAASMKVEMIPDVYKRQPP